jgi:hypothetical protein
LADQGDDVRDRRLVQWILRAGLTTAVALLVTGTVIDLGQGIRDTPPVKLFEIAAVPYTGERVMALGVLVLGLTPGLRVVALLILWARRRDYIFAAVAATVVALLALSALLGGS